jgi:hypothetical protein
MNNDSCKFFYSYELKNMDVNITKPLLRGLIRIAPGETRCDVAYNSCPTTEWLNLPIANYSVTFNHSVVAVTDTINFTGFSFADFQCTRR